MLKNQQPSPVARPWAAFAAAAAAALVLDLWTKQWVWDVLRPGGRALVVWDPVLELAFTQNYGSAFGVFRRLDYPLAHLAVHLILYAWIVATIRAAGGTRLRFAAAGLIVGGGLGNLYDRLFRGDGLGQRGVVDFIKVNFPWGGSWPSFNIADAALLVGAVLLLWSLARRGD